MEREEGRDTQQCSSCIALSFPLFFSPSSVFCSVGMKGKDASYSSPHTILKGGGKWQERW